MVADQEDRTRRLIVDVLQIAINSNPSDRESQLLYARRQNETAIRRSVETELLECLKFPTIAERFEEVIEAHPKTFQWIFQELKESVHAGKDKRWSDFPEWLQSGSGIYWINGKAASGKSTLMKYIYMHPDTAYHLRKWAANYCKAGFFF